MSESSPATTTNDVAMPPTEESVESDDVQFHDALNRLMGGQARPKTDEDVRKLQELLTKLVGLCGMDKSKWKSLVLALVYKRYHVRAPEAKLLLKEGSENSKKSNGKATIGNGERRIFYVSHSHLFELLLGKSEEENTEMPASALKCLLEIAPLAGGSRDVCSIIERFVAGVLGGASMKAKRVQIEEFFGSESLSLLVASGVKLCSDGLNGNEAKVVLDNVLQLAGDTLEDDKKILDARSSDDAGGDASKMLPSTIHIFIPHRDRGRPSKEKKKETKKVPDRQLANSVAEILVWARTSLMSSNKAFSGSYKRLLDAVSTSLSNESKEKAKAALQTLQTIIRKERKKFNDFARKEGFMLTDLFQHDQNAIVYRQIVKGKEGDLNKLTQMAKKKGSSNVLRLINARYASDPSKITRFDSVRALVHQWSAKNSDSNNDEVDKLEHEILMARLKATIKYLRATFKRTEREIVLASLDSTIDSHTAALLVAAAMGRWDINISKDEDTNMADNDADSDVGCRLHLPGGVIHDVDSLQKFSDLLTRITKSDPEIFPSMAESDGSATIKAVVNVIEKHLKANQTLFAFSSSELKLPADCAKHLVKQDCSIHQHDVDDIQQRLRREGAKRGDITISLSWDTHDDLDLHVTLPNGEEIMYSNKSSDSGKATLDVDMNASSPYSNAPVENVFVGDLDRTEEAPPGKYKVIVQNYSYHAEGSTKTTEIPWVVVVSKNGEKEKHTGKCVGSGKDSNVVACEFEYVGRTIPIADKQEQPSGEASDSVNITTSIGQTLEALATAIKAVGQQEQLNEVRQLLDDNNGDDEMKEAEPERPVISARYEVTNRDRNQVLIFNLPARFHNVVNKAFGGGDLAEHCADTMARRMVLDKIPVSELKRAGYPEEIVGLVREKMKVV